MSESADKLAASRRAIVDYIQRRDRQGQADDGQVGADEGEKAQARDRGWFGSIKHAASVWWRHHPAHMALEVGTPLLAAFTRDKPVPVLVVAAVAGAALVVMRPWRLLSLTGVLLAVAKSSQLSGVLMAAMTAAEGWHSQRPPSQR